MRHSVKRPSVQLLRLLSFVESVLSKGFLGPQLVIITIITTIITTIIIITIIIMIIIILILIICVTPIMVIREHIGRVMMGGVII